MAKAPQKHVDRLRNFLQFTEELIKIDPTINTEWEKLKRDWEEDEDFTKIIEQCEDKYGFKYEFYFDFFQSNISHIYGRILMGYEVLVENVCNPELDYLDYKDDIKKGIELVDYLKENKMKERIQIDGVWYIRETEPQPDFIDVEITKSMSALYENDDYCWEAIKLLNDDDTPQDDIYVEFIDKKINPKKIDYWDNMLWIKSVYENNPDSIAQALEMMTDDGILHFRSFLNELKKMGWF